MALNEKAVLSTVLYADIFSFPLTSSEIWSNLLSDKQINRSGVDSAISTLLKRKILFRESEYISVRNDKNLFKSRIGSVEILQNKYLVANKAASILAKIPSVYLIGISGSVAAGNARKEDDIDFFIVSRDNMLWTTRLLSAVSLLRHGLNRKRNDEKVADKICLNMFVSLSNLKIPASQQDIYIAHEVSQLVPLYSRNGTYEKFIAENLWIKNFLANFRLKKPFVTGEEVEVDYGFMYRSPMVQLAKYSQKTYMKPHKTTEKISDDILAFHPYDYRKYALEEYEERIKRFKLKNI